MPVCLVAVLSGDENGWAVVLAGGPGPYRGCAGGKGSTGSGSRQRRLETFSGTGAAARGKKYAVCMADDNHAGGANP